MPHDMDWQIAKANKAYVYMRRKQRICPFPEKNKEFVLVAVRI
jgi:hypothetical protein